MLLLRTPVRIRWWIFIYLFLFLMLAYVQQKSLSIAATSIMPELHLSQMQIGWLMFAFTAMYAGMQLPGVTCGGVPPAPQGWRNEEGARGIYRWPRTGLLCRELRFGPLLTRTYRRRPAAFGRQIQRAPFADVGRTCAVGGKPAPVGTHAGKWRDLVPLGTSLGTAQLWMRSRVSSLRQHARKSLAGEGLRGSYTYFSPTGR